ncbi:MAG: SH3 domain-containing protein, partial [Candidatus Fermentibacteria bacterium]
LSGCGSTLAEETSNPDPIQNPLPNPFQSVVVTGSFVNLRQGPGTQYTIVGSVRAGDSLMVTGEAPDWYRVFVPEKSLFAWIYSGLTSQAVMPR